MGSPFSKPPHLRRFPAFLKVFKKIFSDFHCKYGRLLKVIGWQEIDPFTL